MQPSFGNASIYPQPGDVLDGKYRVERLLGEGGMGAVAKATHLLRRAPVALKFMSGAVLSLQGAVERFVNEGVAASQIDSDHVVKVFDVGRLPSGAPYLVMEYLDGCDLGQLLEREGPTLPVARAVHFIVQALRALQTAHAAGIIHRDMKPSNCFVIDKDGEADFVKLVDFGISKVRATEDGQAAHLTRTNSALGTPLYMSPEQARSPRDVDARTDLYSVGAILYEMLSGRTPYTSETGEFTEILFKIFTTEPEPLATLRPDLPEGLCAVVHHALQRDPKDRFGSAAEMAEALTPFADERSTQVFVRLRGTRRSNGPMHSLTPAAESARVSKSEATARTFPSFKDSAAPTPKPPSTEVGVTKEAAATRASATHPSRKGLVIVAVAAAIAAGAGFVALRGHSPASPPIQPEPSAAALPPPASAPVPPPASAAPSSQTVLVAPEESPLLAPPLPSSSAAPPAHVAPTAKSGPHVATPPPATAANPNAALPTQLGDLKLH
jgi:eukaryotic-like serine/threonine-protein kinase